MENKKQIIELYENSNVVLNTAVDQIIVEIVKKKKQFNYAQTLLLTGVSPLAGTTSIAISLAIAMANTGRKTVLVDCDLRKSFRYKKSNDNIKKGLSDILSDEFMIISDFNAINYETNIQNLYLIPCGGLQQNATRIICSEKMDGLLNELKAEYECIIFDFPSINVVPDAKVMMSRVDGIILISALGETRKKQLTDARRLLKPYAENYYGMIINKTPMDLYKANVKNYNYYGYDSKGNQKFETSKMFERYKKSKGKAGASSAVKNAPANDQSKEDE